ncbi:MAG: plasmid stabilization system protein [Planctomycetota bacterium]|nr:plasmid stabilization system protein [Planctomycetota bacterium]
MTPELQIRPAAQAEIDEIADRLAQASPDIARRFYDRIEETFARLAARPGLGEVFDVAIPALAGLRCTSVNRFKAYLIFYLPRDGGIEVVHVRHGARDNEGLFLREDEGHDEP